MASEAPEGELRPARRTASPALLAAVLGLGALLLVGATVSYARTARTPSAPPDWTSSADARLAPVQGVPPVTLHRDELYPRNDRWAAYLADEETCPGGERTDLPLAFQATTMACLIDYARAKRGLGPLTPTGVLGRSALAKATRIVGCRQFTHAACGIDPASEARAGGYHNAFGENLYVASGRSGAPRVALDGWLNSATHRQNLFRAEWRIEGIAVEVLPEFGPYHDATLWVHQFGTG